MNPEVKAKWLAALRSGDYAQAKGSLKDDLYEDENNPTEATSVGYCCLGVLCELARQEGGVLTSISKSFSGIYNYDGESGLLPFSVQQWSGLNDSSPEYQNEDGEYIWLTDLNDNGKTFAELADIIEEKF